MGNIISQTKYSKGEIIYFKFQNEEKYWIEFNGKMFKEGTIRKVYTQYNSLVSSETMLANFKQRVNIFYENSGKLKEDYTSGIGGQSLTGKYIIYFENGKIEVDGQYYNGEFTKIKVGTWKWYKADGSLEATEIYKAEVEKWGNGEIKMAGGYIFDSENDTWLKTGEWRWYTEDRKFQSSKKYNLGV